MCHRNVCVNFSVNETVGNTLDYSNNSYGSRSLNVDYLTYSSDVRMMKSPRRESREPSGLSEVYQEQITVKVQLSSKPKLACVIV